MALIGNYSVLNKHPGFQIAGSSISDVRSQFNKNGSMRNMYLTFGPKNAVPNGYLPPYSWVLPITGGGLASYTLSYGAISQATANLAGARNLVGSAVLEIVVSNATLDQIVSGEGSASLVMAVSNAALAAAAGATASGTMTIVVSDALLGAIFSVTATSTMSASADDKTITAIGHMDADAGGATPLSPEGLAASLLDNEDIETGYSLREALRLILAAVAGKVSGAGTATITIRSATDGSNRIVATVDSNGNRTAVTLNAGDE